MNIYDLLNLNKKKSVCKWPDVKHSFPIRGVAKTGKLVDVGIPVIGMTSSYVIMGEGVAHK